MDKSVLKSLYSKAKDITPLKPRGYFSNSIHVPVWEQVDPFTKIDIEAPLGAYSSAGCITYVEIGDNADKNLKALEQIVLYAKEKNTTYFAVNVPLAECTECGYNDSIPFDCECPNCSAHDEKINHFARVTGYLSTKVKHFNPGKQAETKERYVHVNKIKDWKKKTCESCI